MSSAASLPAEKREKMFMHNENKCRECGKVFYTLVLYRGGRKVLCDDCGAKPAIAKRARERRRTLRVLDAATVWVCPTCLANQRSEWKVCHSCGTPRQPFGGNL